VERGELNDPLTGAWATVVRAAVVGTLVRSALGLGVWEMRGGDWCGEEGQAPRPFIGSKAGAGRRWRHQCRSSGSVGRGNRG
jgi:hypothetical protein